MASECIQYQCCVRGFKGDSHAPCAVHKIQFEINEQCYNAVRYLIIWFTKVLNSTNTNTEHRHFGKHFISSLHFDDILGEPRLPNVVYKAEL